MTQLCEKYRTLSDIYKASIICWITFMVLIVLIAILFWIAGFFSFLKMEIYAAERKLLPYWKLLSRLYLPTTLYFAYIESTKKEYGYIGKWFKVHIISFLGFGLSIITGIIISVLKK